MQKGWIKLHRKLLDNPIWQDPHYMKLWMYCLLQASHAEHDQLVGNQIIKLLPGQFVTGRISLAEEMNRGVAPKKRQSESTWWRDLKRFEEWGMLNIKANSKYSIVTVGNWALYQETEKEMDSKRTADEQQVNSEWTASEQHLNTNKNVKNLSTKELKNLSSSSPSSSPIAPSLINLDLKEVTNFYEQQHFGMITPHVADRMADWIDDMSKDLVIMAMKLAIENGVAKWSYAEGILKNWNTRKLSTVEQVTAFEKQREQQKNVQQQNTGSRRSFGSQREEKIPDWFNKRKDAPEAEREPDPDIEERRRKLQEELDEMSARVH
ncbi:DnaD domain-containing protein [Sporosarcina sp. FSL K6-1508]|uniref:DnaD domain-containing protein n=1 Tax=Sporosarcina sp. FSL K6-1508 TaxID=2921553 RepID=UPI0030F8E49C